MHNKLIALTLLTALVGCAKYESYYECNREEKLKLLQEMLPALDVQLSEADEKRIQRYCLEFMSPELRESLSPDVIIPEYDPDSWMYNYEWP